MVFMALSSFPYLNHLYYNIYILYINGSPPAAEVESEREAADLLAHPRPEINQDLRVPRLPDQPDALRRPAGCVRRDGTRVTIGGSSARAAESSGGSARPGRARTSMHVDITEAQRDLQTIARDGAGPHMGLPVVP
jgi:hypothetical protein